jgi:YD repeat-containing protein
VPGWAVVANGIYEPILTGKTYTAYGVIKTDGVSGSGAVININILDAAGVYLNQKSSKALTGASYDWTVVSVSLSASEAKAISANAAQMRVSVGTRGATTVDMYFDMVRLIDERAETTYEYTGNYITAVTDVMGNKTSMTRDSRRNAVTQTDPKGNASTMVYNLIDQLKR